MNEQTPTVTTKRTIGMVCCIVVGLLLGVAMQSANLDTMAAPLLWLSNALRTLAGFGWWGNLLVWLIVLDGTLAPLVYAICRQYKAERKTQADTQTQLHTQPQADTQTQVDTAAQPQTLPSSQITIATPNVAPNVTPNAAPQYGVDWLLILLSVQIFAFWYFLINPSYISQPQGLPMQGAYLMVTLWAIITTFGSYLILRLAQSMQRLPMEKTMLVLPRLLQGSALFVFMLSAASESQSFLVSVAATKSGNTGAVGQTIAMLFILSAVRLGVTLLSGITLFWCAEVATALLQAPYAQQTVGLCRSRAKSCMAVVVWAVLAGVAGNLMQLIWFGVLQDVSVSFSIPLLPLLLAGALFLLCHYVAGARALAQDNDSII